MTPTPHGQEPEALRLADLLRLQAAYHREVASDCDMRAEDTINWGHGEVCDRAADELHRLHAENEALRAQQPASPPAEQQAPKETLGGVNGWRDISTAPKDGSRFVAIGYNYGLYSEGRHICVAQWFRGCWMEASDWNETSELKYLTHWMPLPSPPDDVAAPAEQQAPKAAPVDQSELHTEALRLSEILIAMGQGSSPAPEELWADDYEPSDGDVYVHRAGLVLAMLAAPQQEAQEPVAYVHVPHYTVEGKVRPVVSFEKYQQDYADGIYSTRIPLYTAPQPAPAPLSDDVVRDAARYAAVRDGSIEHDDILKTVKDPGKWEQPYAVLLRGVALDSAIDAALAAQGGK